MTESTSTTPSQHQQHLSSYTLSSGSTNRFPPFFFVCTPASSGSTNRILLHSASALRNWPVTVSRTCFCFCHRVLHLFSRFGFEVQHQKTYFTTRCNLKKSPLLLHAGSAHTLARQPKNPYYTSLYNLKKPNLLLSVDSANAPARQRSPAPRPPARLHSPKTPPTPVYIHTHSHTDTQTHRHTLFPHLHTHTHTHTHTVPTSFGRTRWLVKGSRSSRNNHRASAMASYPCTTLGLSPPRPPPFPVSVAPAACA